MRKFMWVATVTAAAFLWPSAPSMADFLSTCETEIKKRLLAPTTYRRHSASRLDIKMTEAEYVEVYVNRMSHPNDNQKMISALRIIAKHRANEIINSGRAITLFVYDVAYDANNAFGVPIRARSRCEAMPYDGKESSIDSRDVRIR